MKEILKAALNGNLDEYKSIPFWSWNNTLDENELVKQIVDMKRAGIGGFIMHARTGLKDEYLGEKWFRCIKACLDKARELNMETWVYDENGWPSGFAGGKLLENESYRARFLEYSIGDFDRSAFATYVTTASGYERVTSPIDGVEVYHNVYLRVSPSNTDILDPVVVDAFIAETHERYYERFKESFGRELAGFFTDEPQYYRWGTPYTHCVDAAFEKDGEDVRDGLIWLFVHDERGYAFRQKYFKELNRLYVENFYKKIHDWCKLRGCKLTGHSIEEGGLGSQMWGGADVMTTYVEEDIPAVDWLGRRCGTELAPKQVGSVAEQFGKKCVLTETFACSGNDVTPKELKSVGDFQYFNGVTKTCQHLYPFSMARGGKVDYPPVFSPQGNWFEGFKLFNDYFTRLGYIIANTEENCDIAVISPLRDVWSDFVKAEDTDSVAAIDAKFNELISILRRNGVTYQIVDETLLGEYGKVDCGKLVLGQKSYAAVLLPEMRNIGESTLEILAEYDGKFCSSANIEFIDGKPCRVKLQGNCSLQDIIDGAKVGFKCDDGRSFVTSRSGDIGDFLFVKNLSYDLPSSVKIKDASVKYRKLDLVDLTESDISDEFELAGGEGVVLIASDCAQPLRENQTENDVTDAFCVKDISENYLISDYCKISLNGVDYSDIRPICCHFEDLLRKNYRGILYVKQTFKLNAVMPLTLIMEKADFKFVKINGCDVELKRGDFDVYFYETDISDKVKDGENELVYSIDFYEHDGVNFALFNPLATESLRNCLYYDTSIETIYLKGDFVVEKDLSISPKRVLPPVTDRLCDFGYPFFKGVAKYSGRIKKPDNGRAVLYLKGRFMTAKIKTTKGERLFVLDDKGDITDLLDEGFNEIEITLNSSLRNLFGPHHWKPESEPLGVGPYHFDFRGGWADGKKPDEYTDEYNSVPFGINKIILKNYIR